MWYRIKGIDTLAGGFQIVYTETHLAKFQYQYHVRFQVVPKPMKVSISGNYK